jgi:hypothetical protein
MKTNLIILSLCLTLLASCATLQSEDSSRDLEEKVFACWQAKKDKVWEKAYECFCEDYRNRISKEGFIKSANVEIRSFHIDGITFSEGKKEARVSLSYEALMLGYEFNDIKIEEHWVYEKNDWYLSPKRKKLEEVFEK